MYSRADEVRARILETLRHGPLTIPEIAEQLDEAQFLVRAELKALRRDRLVADELGQERDDWRLTDTGVKRANFADQLRLA